MPPRRSPRAVPRAKAKAHFLAAAATRSRRAALLDAARRKQQLLGPADANAWRYLEPSGPRRYDFVGVDDGSPRAKAVLNAQPYRAPRREPSALLERLERRGRQIGQGQEATVWRLDNRIYKLFDDAVPRERIEANARFLRQHPSVTAKLYRAMPAEGYLKMGELRGYQTLRSYAKSPRFQQDKQQPARVEALLRQLARARAQLGKSVEYSDLRKLDNVALKFNERGRVSSVKFYEGGRRQRYADSERAAEWLLDVASQLGLRRAPFAQQVRRNQVPWLR